MSRKMKRVIAILALVWVLSVALTSLGIACAGRVGGAGPIGVCFFVTGGVIIVLAQLIPAGILLSSLIGTVFSSPWKTEMPIPIT
jgi:hypothetical protein